MHSLNELNRYSNLLRSSIETLLLMSSVVTESERHGLNENLKKSLKEELDLLDAALKKHEEFVMKNTKNKDYN